MGIPSAIVLLYRGYPIDQLVEQCDYLEACWLLLNGDLPSPAQQAKFTDDITHHTMVNEQLHAIYRGFRRDSHPMAVMCGVVGALAAFYHDSLDIFDPRHRLVASHRLIAKMPTIAAMPHKYSLGQPFIYPKNDRGYAEFPAYAVRGAVRVLSRAGSGGAGARSAGDPRWGLRRASDATVRESNRQAARPTSLKTREASAAADSETRSRPSCAMSERTQKSFDIFQQVPVA
jgi:hypothetical protein